MLYYIGIYAFIRFCKENSSKIGGMIRFTIDKYITQSGFYMQENSQRNQAGKQYYADIDPTIFKYSTTGDYCNFRVQYQNCQVDIDHISIEKISIFNIYKSGSYGNINNTINNFKGLLMRGENVQKFNIGHNNLISGNLKNILR